MIRVAQRDPKPLITEHGAAQMLTYCGKYETSNAIDTQGRTN